MDSVEDDIELVGRAIKDLAEAVEAVVEETGDPCCVFLRQVALDIDVWEL